MPPRRLAPCTDTLDRGVGWRNFDTFRVAQQLAGQIGDVLGERRRKQQVLTLGWQTREDFFHVMDEAHVEHAVGFVEHQDFKDKGFSVLGVPCNQFAGQEPGTEQDIQNFCSLNYGVTFPLSSKLEVNGPDRPQLYRLLAGEGAEFPGDITWNFEKFLMGKDGRVLARFSPRTAPDDPSVIQAIEKALA